MHARRLELLEDGRLFHADADVERDAHEHKRQQEGQAPSPGLELRRAHALLGQYDHEQRSKEAQRGGDLDEAGIEAALLVFHMLGHVHCGAAVLAAESQALQHADDDEDDRRKPPGSFKRGQQADGCGGSAHDRQGDDEGNAPADEVADPPEEERAEGPHQEPHRKRSQVGDESEGVIPRGVKLGRQHCRERSEDIEVIPFDEGAGGGAQDDLAERVARVRRWAGEALRRHQYLGLAEAHMPNSKGDRGQGGRRDIEVTLLAVGGRCQVNLFGDEWDCLIVGAP